MLRAIAAACCGTALLAGCAGSHAPERKANPAVRPPPPHATAPPARRHAARPLRRVPCPAGVAGCRTASGRIIYVEAVDPDGDGDAHFVLASDDSITARGISVIDVRRGLRPHPLPGVGEQLSAAGPVYRGSYGQRQIEAVAIGLARD
jgi:hypothetical protein